MKTKQSILILCVLYLTGCSVNMDDLNKAIIERSAFDLNCPNNKISIKLLQGDELDKEYTYGTEGCNKRQIYQVITNLDSFKIYKEGMVPERIIINNYSHNTVNKSSPSPVAPPQVITPPRLGYR